MIEEKKGEKRSLLNKLELTVCKIKCFKSFSGLNNIKYTYKVVGSRKTKGEETFNSTGAERRERENQKTQCRPQQ